MKSTTSSLGKALAPLSPPLGKTVINAGEGLATTLQNLGATVAALLGYKPPGQKPTAGVPRSGR